MCVRQPFRTDSLTDGGDEGGREGVVREPEQNAGLPDAGIANQQQLKQQVVRFLGHFSLKSERASASLGLFTVVGTRISRSRGQLLFCVFRLLHLSCVPSSRLLCCTDFLQNCFLLHSTILGQTLGLLAATKLTLFPGGICSELSAIPSHWSTFR